MSANTSRANSQSPPVVKTLRGEAIREAVVINDSQKSRVKPTFDATRLKAPIKERAADDFDTDNWVAKYPGSNVEHIGNGSGGVRGA